MQTAKPEEVLYAQLDLFLSQQGYQLIPELKQFRRILPQGFQNVVVLSSRLSKELLVDIHIGVRLDIVEDLVHPFLPDSTGEYRPHTNTVIVSIGKLVDIKYMSFQIACPEDAVSCAEQVRYFMEQQGYGFLDYSARLRNLDQMFNKSPRQSVKYLYNQTHRCFKGLALARLGDNPRFAELIGIYENSLRTGGAPEDTIRKYQRLANNLLHFMVN